MNNKIKRKCKKIIENNTNFKDFELDACWWNCHWEHYGSICICRGENPFALYVNYRAETVEIINGYSEYEESNWRKLKIISKKEVMELATKFSSYKIPAKFRHIIKNKYYIAELTYNDLEIINSWNNDGLNY